jgi:hypothetical protein
MLGPAVRKNAGESSFVKLAEEFEDENLIAEDGVLSDRENSL